jgi:hypothetical protein
MQSIELNYVEGSEVRIRRANGSSHLRIEIDGDRCILSGKIKCAFPLSDRNQHLSLQSQDDKEVAILRSPAQLDSESKQLLDEDLERRYFTPKIDRILQLKHESSMWRFDVETQRGTTHFYVRNWRDSAFEIKLNRWQISSVDGQRFEITDVRELDAKSQAFLEQLL